MSAILFSLTILTLIGTALFQVDNRRINEGASTSRELTNYEECEIENYAASLGRLMMAEDIDGGNLVDMMYNRFHELQAFHDQVYSYYVLAEFGAQWVNDTNLRRKRRRFFLQTVQENFLHVLEKASSEHYRYKLWYKYDNETKTIQGRETITQLNQSDCLCLNGEEQLTLSENFVPPVLQQPERIIQVTSDNSGITGLNVSQYNIIPLPLISQFFRVWFDDALEDIPEVNINNCLFTLIGRLRRSMKKLLIVQIRNAGLLPIHELHTIVSSLGSFENPNFFTELFRRANSWLRGIGFLGHRNRGPFSPEYGRRGPQLQLAFEHDAEPIIGRVRHRNLLQLHNGIFEFVLTAEQETPLDRLLNGYYLFSSMMFRLVRYDLTPMDEEQWEEREPTDEDLARVTNPELKRRLKTEKYYAIKKIPHLRDRRSEEYFHYEVEEELPTTGLVKHSWNQLIMNLMRFSIDARSRNKTLSWSCNLTSWYNDYFSHGLDDPAICKSFSKFILSKISLNRNWQECNNGTSLMVSEDWCQAWRRILNLSKNLTNESLETDMIQPLSKSHLEDVTILMRWMSPETGSRVCRKLEPGFDELSFVPYEKSNDCNNSKDTVVCYLLAAEIKKLTRSFLSLDAPVENNNKKISINSVKAITNTFFGYVI